MKQANLGGRECAHYEDWEASPDYECGACQRRTWECAQNAARFLARPDDVDDVTVVATTEVLLGRRFDPARGKFSPFVRLVVKQTARYFRRVEAREQRNIDTAAQFAVNVVRRGGVPYAEDPDAERGLRSMELALMLREVVKDLSPENAQAFGMDLAGYSRVEIARAVPVNGAYITQQAWGQRLRPIEARVAEALELRLQQPPAEP